MWFGAGFFSIRRMARRIAPLLISLRGAARKVPNFAQPIILAYETYASAKISRHSPRRIRDYHEHGIIRPYWCPGNYNVADFFSELLEKGLFTMHAYRFGMNFQV